MKNKYLANLLSAADNLIAETRVMVRELKSEVGELEGMVSTYKPRDKSLFSAPYQVKSNLYDFKTRKRIV